MSDVGYRGVYYVVQVVSKLLDSKTSEFTATYVGRLVSLLISKMGSNLGDSLELMLRAVLSKMQQAETLSVIQVTKIITKRGLWLKIGRLGFPEFFCTFVVDPTNICYVLIMMAVCFVPGLLTTMYAQPLT